MKNLIILFLLTFSTTLGAQVIINEIMYNPPETGGDTLEYIELYNAGNTDVDLAGYYFSNGVQLSISSAIIPANGYIVFSEKASAIQAVFGVASIEWTSGALNNGGEKLEISSPDSMVVDLVDFNDGGDWPSEPDGDGPSLELIATDLDNDLGINWQPSAMSTNIMVNGALVKGSPGAKNSMLSSVLRIADHLVSISPNPAQDVLHIQTNLEIERMEIYSLNGQLLTQSSQIVKGKGLDISSIPSGLHVLRITTSSGFWQGRIVKLSQ